MGQSLGQSSPVLVCFAVREEGRFFFSADVAPRQVEVLITGMGRKNAARAVEAALGRLQPGLVLTCGFAGALDPALTLGAVVYSTDQGGGLEDALAATGARRVTFHGAPRVAVTASEKQRLRATTGADVVEMESEVIRQICRERHIPSATIRVISDTADEDLPLDFNGLMTAEMKLNYPKLAWAVLCAPRRIRGLLQLQRQSRLAAQNLGSTLRRVLSAGLALER